MSLRHLFLGSPGVTAPARWCEAFPDGEVVDPAGQQALLRDLPASASILWLSHAAANWPERLQQVLEAVPGARAVVLSGAPETGEGLRALNAGARGYTHAYAVPALLREVATVVDHGGLWVGPELLQRLVTSTQAAFAQRPAPTTAAATPTGGTAPARSDPWSKLSTREAEVARAVSAGRSNREIGELMFISERTVKAHLGVIFDKLGVRDRLQLALQLAAAPQPQVAPGPTAGPDGESDA